jgi:multidrug transporter EmrE-like cation transporter
MGYVFLILALILNAIANILMKIGSKNIHFFKEINFFDAIIKNYILFFGLCLFAVNIIFYTISLSKINLSIAYPISAGGGFLIISIISFLYLKEPISILQILGMFLVLSGITLISFKS